MSAVITVNHPVFSIVLPTLATRRRAKPVSAAPVARKSSGLAFTDIADASARATAKSGLTERPAALRKLYP